MTFNKWKSGMIFLIANFLTNEAVEDPGLMQPFPNSSFQNSFLIFPGNEFALYVMSVKFIEGGFQVISQHSPGLAEFDDRFPGTDDFSKQPFGKILVVYFEAFVESMLTQKACDAIHFLFEVVHRSFVNLRIQLFEEMGHPCMTLDHKSEIEIALFGRDHDNADIGELPSFHKWGKLHYRIKTWNMSHPKLQNLSEW